MLPCMLITNASTVNCWNLLQTACTILLALVCGVIARATHTITYTDCPRNIDAVFRVAHCVAFLPTIRRLCCCGSSLEVAHVGLRTVVQQEILGTTATDVLEVATIARAKCK